MVVKAKVAECSETAIRVDLEAADLNHLEVDLVAAVKEGDDE